MSVGQISEDPGIVKRLLGDGLETYCRELQMPSRRLEMPPAYFPYGVAYIVKTGALLRERTFYNETVHGFSDSALPMLRD